MASKQCTICQVKKTINYFPLRVKDSSSGKKGELGAICAPCIEQRKTSRKARNLKRKAGAEKAEDGDGDGKDSKIAQDLGAISLADFIEAVTEMDAPMEVCAHIDITEMVAAGAVLMLRDRANALAKAIADVLLVHWM